MKGAGGRSRLLLAGAALALAGAIALRVLYSFQPPPSGDGGLYLHTAGKILSGEYFFSGGARTFDLLYRTPGYPLFLAAIERLSGGSRQVMVLAQHLLGVLSALLAWSIGRRLWGGAAGALAFLFAGLHFHFVYLEAYPLSEPLGVFLLLASFRLALHAGESGARPAAAGLAGLAAGAAALCRSELALLLPAYAVYLYAARGPGRRLAPVAAFLLPGALLLGSWTLRNGLLFDYWGLTPNSAITLFSGPAGDCAVPACGPSDPVCTQAFASQYADGRVNRGVELLERFGVPYHWSARRIGGLASAAAAGSPACWAKGSLAQLRDSLFTGVTWPPRDLTENIPPLLTAGSGGAGEILGALGRADGLLEGWLLAPLFLAGCLAAALRRRREELLLAACALALLLAYAFLSPLVPRYRVVPEALMGLLAAGFPVLVWNALRRTHLPRAGADTPPPAWLGGRLPAAALAAGALCLLVFLGGLFRAAVLLPRRSAAACRAGGGQAAEVCMGYDRLARGKFPAALKSFDAALAQVPADKAAGDGRAAALFRMGRGAESLAELERGLKLYGPSPDTLFNMAVIDHLSGSPAAAGRLDALLKRKDLPPVIRAAAAEMRQAGPPSFTSRRPIE